MSLDSESFFSALANPLRLRTLMLLTQNEELCVCELMYALGVEQPMISRHLALLRESGVVTDRRAGQWNYYRLNPALPNWATSVLAATLDGNRKKEPFTLDRAALRGMPNRPDAACCA